MAEMVEVTAERRACRGTREARRLRCQGKVPGVVYGHKEEPVSLSLAREELERIIRHGVHVVDLKTDGAVQKALIRDVQWDHLGLQLLHVDFARVAEDERVTVNVPIEVRGVAPGVTAGGVLDQPIHSVEVECLVTSVPDSIRVNVGDLQIDSAIHVRDLKLPPGVTVLGDPDQIVVHVTQKQLEAEAAPAPAAAEAGEPEVIGRQREAEPEGE